MKKLVKSIYFKSLILMNQVGYHTKMHSKFHMYLNTTYINFTKKSSWQKHKSVICLELVYCLTTFTTIISFQVSLHTEMLANNCFSCDSSATLTSWPVTTLFNFMTCNNVKYVNGKTYHQILQNLQVFFHAVKNKQFLLCHWYK